MTQFRYRLHALLDKRQEEVDHAQRELAAAQQRLQRENEDLHSCQLQEQRAAEILRVARLKMVSTANGGMTGEWLCLKRDHLRRLRDELNEACDGVRAQEIKVGEAEDGVSRARSTLGSKSRELETLEKHKRQLESRFKAEEERKETLAVEEMAHVINLQGKARHEAH